MNIIKEATKDCQRHDCSLTEGAGIVTCMGWTPTFDKHGNRTDRGDPNIWTTSVRCLTCGRSWIARTQYNKTDLSEDKPPVAVNAQERK